jgi:hypothetical protein
MSVGIAAKWPGKPKKAQLGAGVTNKRGHFLRTFRPSWNRHEDIAVLGLMSESSILGRKTGKCHRLKTIDH